MRYKEEIFFSEGAETLSQAAQIGNRCFTSGNIQGKAGQDSEQPNQVEDVSAYCRGLELDDFKGPFQTEPSSDSIIDSMIL